MPRSLVWASVALVVAGGVLIAFAIGRPVDRSSIASGRDTRPDALVDPGPPPTPTSGAAADGAGAVPRLPDGALPPILDEPRLDRLDFCDERNWRRVDGVVRAVRDGQMIVEEDAWARTGASARAGLAGWASRCRLEGAAVTIRSGESGRTLGHYDPVSGYQARS